MAMEPPLDWFSYSPSGVSCGSLGGSGVQNDHEALSLALPRTSIAWVGIWAGNIQKAAKGRREALKDLRVSITLPDWRISHIRDTGHLSMLTPNDNKLKNTTIITGVGRSGTTFLAHVFHNAGYDLGVTPESIGLDVPDGGLEHYNTTQISRTNSTELLDHYPTIIKDPTFALALPKWIALGQRPQHAIFTCRDVNATYDSTTKYGLTTRLDIIHQWYTGLRNILSAGIPVTIIPFPEIGENPIFAEQLKPWIENPWEIIQATYDKEKIHHG